MGTTARESVPDDFSAPRTSTLSSVIGQCLVAFPDLPHLPPEKRLDLSKFLGRTLAEITQDEINAYASTYPEEVVPLIRVPGSEHDSTLGAYFKATDGFLTSTDSVVRRRAQAYKYGLVGRAADMAQQYPEIRRAIAIEARWSDTQHTTAAESAAALVASYTLRIEETDRIGAQRADERKQRLKRRFAR